MNNSNSPLPVGENGAPVSAAAATAVGVNGRRRRIHSGQQLGVPENGKGRPSPPAAEQILDENLDDDDIRVSIAVVVHGRTKKFANLKFDRAVYAAMRDDNRGIFFEELDHLLKEIQQAIASKLNRKLDAGRRPDPENDKGNGHQPSANGGEPPLITKPIPLYTQKDDREISEFLRIHRPPAADAL